jgi:hypothetical protein
MTCHSEPYAVILSAAKDLALGFYVEGPNQGEMLRCARDDMRTWVLSFRATRRISLWSLGSPGVCRLASVPPGAQVLPVTIYRLDQGNLPHACPAFDLLFSADRGPDITEGLVIHQAADVVACGESFLQFVPVLQHPSFEIVCHPRVQGARRAGRCKRSTSSCTDRRRLARSRDCENCRAQSEILRSAQDDSGGLRMTTKGCPCRLSIPPATGASLPGRLGGARP